MKLTRILSIFFLTGLLVSCGGSDDKVNIDIGDGTNPVTDVGNPSTTGDQPSIGETPDNNEAPEETPAEEQTEEEIQAELEAKIQDENIEKLVELTGKDNAEIIAAAEELNLNLGKITDTSKTKILRLSAKLDPEIKTLSDELLNDNFHGLDIESFEKAGDLKEKMRPYLAAFYPELSIKLYPRGLTEEEKAEMGVVLEILTAIVRGIKAELFYNIDDKCISFIRYGKIESDKMSHDDLESKGTIVYISCENAFKDPVTLILDNQGKLSTPTKIKDEFINKIPVSQNIIPQDLILLPSN